MIVARKWSKARVLLDNAVTFMNHEPISLFRSSRRRSSMTQDDVAFLVGLRAASQVSRHESGEREPDLRLALGYKLIFNATVHELLPHIYLDVAQQISSRARTLLNRESEIPETQRSTCKIEHLRDLVRRVEAINITL
jgi:DNA-binding XRE family transcriptional regulator